MSRPPALRPMTAADLPLLARWLADPEVATYYKEPAAWDHIRAKFGPRTRGEGHVRACILTWRGADVGYAQHYLLPAGERAALGLDAGRAWGGFDLLLGEARARGRGLGLGAVQALLAALAAEGANAAAVDVWVGNARAVHVYAKAGLAIARRLPRRERWRGQWRDHWLMTADLPVDPGP